MSLVKVRGHLWTPNTGSLRSEKSEDTTIASSTSVQFDEHLHVTLLPHAHYRVHAALFLNVAGDGIRLGLSGPRITATDLLVQALIYDTTLRSVQRLSALGAEITHNQPGVGEHHVTLNGCIDVGHIGGELHVAWAQQTSDPAGLTMQKNSFLEVSRIT